MLVPQGVNCRAESWLLQLRSRASIPRTRPAPSLLQPLTASSGAAAVSLQERLPLRWRPRAKATASRPRRLAAFACFRCVPLMACCSRAWCVLMVVRLICFASTQDKGAFCRPAPEPASAARVTMPQPPLPSPRQVCMQAGPVAKFAGFARQLGLIELMELFVLTAANALSCFISCR